MIQTDKLNFKQYEEIVAPGKEVCIEAEYNVVSLLEGELNAFDVFLGTNGNESKMDSGLTLKGDSIATRLRIINITNIPQYLKICYGIGDIQDNRLKVSGIVNTKDTGGAPYALTVSDVITQTFDETGFLTFIPDNARYTILQNKGSNKVNLYAIDGPEVYPTGTDDTTLSNAFKVYGTQGDKVCFVRYR